MTVSSQEPCIQIFASIQRHSLPLPALVGFGSSFTASVMANNAVGRPGAVQAFKDVHSFVHNLNGLHGAGSSRSSNTL